jgi:DNA-binding transcriptional ArsR family regulator
MSGNDRDLVFAALGDTCRRLLLDRLRQRNGQTITALAEGLAITRQAVTKHLAVLEGAGLVVTRKRGREKLHFLNPVPIHAVAMRWLKEFDALRLDALGGGE